MNCQDAALEKLVAGYLDGYLSIEQSTQLQDRLRSTQAARQYFLEIVHLHAALVGDGEIAGNIGWKLDERAKNRPHPLVSLGLGKGVRTVPGIVFFAAACLAILCTSLVYYHLHRTTEPFAEVVRIAGVDQPFLTGKDAAINQQMLKLPQGVIELRTTKGVVW